MSITGKLDPILADSTLYIRGKQLASELTKVRIGGFELSPSQVSDHQITVALSGLSVNYLRAGVQGLQVIHCIRDAPASLTNCTVESNVAPFVLRPSIKSVSTSNPNGRRKDLQSAILTLQVDVVVGIKQRVILAMNEWSIDNPVGYQLEAIPRKTDTDTVAFALEAVKPGEYLLRLLIDGAESLLSIDTDETSLTFNWYNAPKVRIE